jgi:AraC-like DNA-binding protein
MFASGTTRVGGMKAIFEVITNLGYDPDPIIRRSGLSRESLADPDFIVPSSIFGELFQHCVDATGCRHFGMLVGAEGSFAWLGRIGFIARNSENVLSALKNLGEYFFHHDRSALVVLTQTDDFASLSYTLLFEMEARAQWLSGVMCFGVKIMRELCGPSWKPSEVTFAMPRPADIRPYEKFFRSKLSFDSSETALLFDSNWLGHVVEDAQPELCRLLIKDLEKDASLAIPDFPQDVLRIARTFIGTGQCSAEKISGLLGVSTRSLYAKLAAHDTSFKLVVEGARFEMAKQLIQNTDMPLSGISERLDYSEISAFTRAFSRWAGTSPGNWRRGFRAESVSH